ncbi:uncharacterized protein VICG_01300 [Vittaforma corneae ATCC 50505]|uniref:Transcription factor TFIIIB component B'' Myb domain-containing protein n=1 Tax=Vittaforma corneae (strain ATCC 50505) TaxID=993615 RepID=L2GMY9_VITCO|nr:uncharacterized protein VICG_01300 [Vittaforma corneae ATCC 50505]ELA41667.1 hypothetical protein VICG_01300 [Vittaforma corneae ATCC 50505]
MKNKGNRKRWNREENDLFYSALECCGLDFSIMNLLFPDRTRSNLKDKYKRESKVNTHKIEDVLNSYKGFNVEKFEKLKSFLKKPLGPDQASECADEIEK